jgi:hypothetical protein
MIYVLCLMFGFLFDLTNDIVYNVDMVVYEHHHDYDNNIHYDQLLLYKDHILPGGLMQERIEFWMLLDEGFGTQYKKSIVQTYKGKTGEYYLFDVYYSYKVYKVQTKIFKEVTTFGDKDLEQIDHKRFDKKNRVSPFFKREKSFLQILLGM